LQLGSNFYSTFVGALRATVTVLALLILSARFKRTAKSSSKNKREKNSKRGTLGSGIVTQMR
jgi:hypothetical protein